MSKYDKASLVMIPSGYKAEKVYSVLPVNGDGDFTFDRNSTATRVNKDGYIETVATDTPRLDYPLIDGVVQDCPSLLLEPARTNLVTYSEDTTEWDKNQTPINTSNTTISPNGSQNADSVIVNSISEGFYDFSVGTVNSGTSYTFSIFIKHISGIETIRFGGSGSGFGGDNNNVFNIKNGTVVSVASGNTLSVNDYGNGWYRLIATKTASSTATAAWILYGNENAEIQYSAWGVQVEQGSYATSYIPTSGSAVTRAAETANGAGTSDDFNDSEGVLFAECSFINNTGTSSPYQVQRIGVSDGTDTNRIFISNTTTANQIQVFVRNSTGISFNKIVTIDDITQQNKISLKYKANDYALWINGFELETDTTYDYLPDGLDELKFKGATNYAFLGKTKEVSVFKTALTDSELESLTSWDSFSDMATGQEYSIR